ncbi:MAG: dockerin type I domain-containing protein [Planctomycetota bacterium]
MPNGLEESLLPRSSVQDVSGDGKVAVGRTLVPVGDDDWEYEAWTWSEAAGRVILSPAPDEDTSVSAWRTDYFGRNTLGTIDRSGSSKEYAFFRADHDPITFETLLADAGLNLEAIGGTALYPAVISGDGRTIAGSGYNLDAPGGPMQDVFVVTLLAAVPGDTDADGRVDQTDLNAVLANWGRTENAFGATGDVTGDRVVDQADLNAVLSHWGAQAAPNLEGLVVPEPAAGVLLVSSGIVCLLWRRDLCREVSPEI